MLLTDKDKKEKIMYRFSKRYSKSLYVAQEDTTLWIKKLMNAFSRNRIQASQIQPLWLKQRNYFQTSNFFDPQLCNLLSLICLFLLDASQELGASLGWKNLVVHILYVTAYKYFLSAS